MSRINVFQKLISYLFLEGKGCVYLIGRQIAVERSRLYVILTQFSGITISLVLFPLSHFQVYGPYIVFILFFFYTDWVSIFNIHNVSERNLQ